MQTMPKAGLGQLLTLLSEQGYEVVAPTVADGAIVYDAVESPADLPQGWRDHQEPGRYRLERRDDDAYFGYVVGPHSWKQFLFPPHETLTVARRDDDGVPSFARAAVAGDRPRAFVGVRACEIAAIEVQDRVFLGEHYEDPRYRRRREQSLIVAVNCLEPGELCFCTSMDTGPRAQRGFDLCLTEYADHFLVEAGSARGEELLARLETSEAPAGAEAELEADVERSANAMGRSVATTGLADLIQGNLDHHAFADVAERCLACGNCTSVCPTCFCSTVTDDSSLDGRESTRSRQWDSCFSGDHSSLHGGAVRSTVGDRYRQWFAHKLSTWNAQFGTSGCVGCGRCIAWCPVGIDITEEVNALSEGAADPAPLPRVETVVPGEREQDLVPVACEVVANAEESEGVRTLHLRAPPDFRFAHGQFNMLAVPGVGEVPISISGLTAGNLEHTIAAVGAVTEALCALKPGQHVGLRGPYGSSWPIERGEGGQVVLVAGGLGLAPMRSSIRAMLGAPDRFPDVKLFYGSRNAASILYVHEMLGWLAVPSFEMHVTVDHADPSWRGNIGVVTRLLRNRQLDPDATYLVCGPEVMMRFAVAELLEAGAKPGNVHVSMERNMKCAVGFCGRCQYGSHFLCKDGPVLPYDSVANIFGRHGF